MKKTTKTELEFLYFITKGDSFCQENTSSIALSKQETDDCIDYVRTHPSGEFVDLPAKVYDRFIEAAISAAQDVMPDIWDEGYEVELPLYLPESLLGLLPEDVLNLLPEELTEEDKNETDEEELPYEPPTKQNTLYLPIKQVFFDRIMDGTKKEEFREISPNTYKKYLECDEHGWPFYDNSILNEQDLDFYADLYDYVNACKDGQFPFFFKESIKYLNLAVGYNKVRDTATVEVLDITPMIGENNKGQQLRFNLSDDGKPVMAEDGRFCIWTAVFHLGKVVEKNIVSKSRQK